MTSDYLSPGPGELAVNRGQQVEILDYPSDPASQAMVRLINRTTTPTSGETTPTTIEGLLPASCLKLPPGGLRPPSANNEDECKKIYSIHISFTPIYEHHIIKSLTLKRKEHVSTHATSRTLFFFIFDSSCFVELIICRRKYQITFRPLKIIFRLVYMKKNEEDIMPQFFFLIYFHE